MFDFTEEEEEVDRRARPVEGLKFEALIDAVGKTAERDTPLTLPPLTLPLLLLAPLVYFGVALVALLIDERPPPPLSSLLNDQSSFIGRIFPWSNRNLL